MKSFETSIASYSVITDESEIDVSSIPPQFRRRLSPLQKIYFSLAAKLQAETYDYAVFSSEFGEDSLTRRLVADFNDGIGISPQRFSTSVYNAAPGLWSVFAKEHNAYTAIAAGEDSIECALIEALGHRGKVLCVHAEEAPGQSIGEAIIFDSSADAAGRRIAVCDGDAGNHPMEVSALREFLAAKAKFLSGRFISLKYCE